MTANKKTDGLNIYQRIHAAMLEVTYVQKDKTIEVGHGYKVVTHDAVTAKVRPSLVKHGIIYFPSNLVFEQNGNRTEVSLDLVFQNIEQPEDRLTVPTFGYGIDSGDKGPGKAMSYAVKYALLKALGLETGEDADNDGEVEHKPAANKPGISAVRAEVNDTCREFHSCADSDTLLAFINTPKVKKLMLRVCADYPVLWAGDEEYSGLKGSLLHVGKDLGIEPEALAYAGQVQQAAIKFHKKST